MFRGKHREAPVGVHGRKNRSQWRKLEEAGVRSFKTVWNSRAPESNGIRENRRRPLLRYFRGRGLQLQPGRRSSSAFFQASRQFRLEEAGTKRPLCLSRRSNNERRRCFPGSVEFRERGLRDECRSCIGTTRVPDRVHEKTRGCMGREIETVVGSGRGGGGEREEMEKRTDKRKSEGRNGRSLEGWNVPRFEEACGQRWLRRRWWRWRQRNRTRTARREGEIGIRGRMGRWGEG